MEFKKILTTDTGAPVTAVQNSRTARPGGPILHEAAEPSRATMQEGRETLEPTLSEQVVRNVETIFTLREKADETIGKHQKVIERGTQEIGCARTIYLTMLVVVIWVTFNTAAPYFSMRPPDPPPFSWLQGVVGLCALFMTTMILTTQNRHAAHADQRAHLDLQVNLLAEQKVAKLIALVEELRRDLPNVHDRHDPIAKAMTQAVDPTAVISALEETQSPKARPPTSETHGEE